MPLRPISSLVEQIRETMPLLAFLREPSESI
jgi:hypothetical protein